MSGLRAPRGWVLALLLLWAAGARAQDAPGSDAEAVFADVSARMDAFEYAEAIGLLSDLIARQPPAEIELRARALVVRAEASRGEESAARAAAEALFRRDPGFDLPDDSSLSPRIRAHFVDARRAVRTHPPAPAEARIHAADGRVRMRVGSQTPALVERVVIGIRDGDGFREIEAAAAEGGGYVAVLPHAPALRYYVRFVSPSGYVVAEAGSPDVPLTWTDAGTAAADARSEAQPIPPNGEDYTGLAVGLGVGVALVVATVIALVLWQPWNEGATLSRGLELP